MIYRTYHIRGVMSTLWCGRLYIVYGPSCQVYIRHTWPFTPAWCWFLKLLACYRKAMADVHAMAINHNTGRGKSRGRPDPPWSRPGSIKKAVLTYNFTNTSYKHGCVLRYKPCWRRHKQLLTKTEDASQSWRTANKLLSMAPNAYKTEL